MTLREQIRKLFRLFLLLTVLVAVALFSAITTIRLTIHGNQETMPSLVGMTLAAAERTASYKGLVVKVEDKIFSAQRPADQIVSQQPPAGTRIKVGQHVHVIVSLGPPRVAIPNLVGSSLRAAQITAAQRGLTVGSVAAMPWAGNEADQVVAQDPPPATPDVHSLTISLLVSLGEAPPAFLCPNVTGQPLAIARRELEKAGMKVGEITPLPAANTPAGTILFQTPAPGSKIGPEAVFSFQVSQ
ncbi:MAG: PASTA domain-containing protein [Acidobacteriia bacterium]|nr:PASTA domain-containing protein [Terriglobia bacterium]